jgi:hypothetical protein
MQPILNTDFHPPHTKNQKDIRTVGGDLWLTAKLVTGGPFWDAEGIILIAYLKKATQNLVSTILLDHIDEKIC